MTFKKLRKYIVLCLLTTLAIAASASWYHLNKIKNSTSFEFENLEETQQKPKIVLVEREEKNPLLNGDIPLTSCISDGVSDSMILSTVNDLEENARYYSVLLKLTEGNYRDNWVQDLFMVSGEVCVSLSPGFEQPSSKRPGLVSLSQFVSEKVARQLALNRWERVLQEHYSGSREELKKSLERATQPGPDRVYLFQEDIWALSQLRIESSKIVVSESANISY